MKVSKQLSKISHTTLYLIFLIAIQLITANNSLAKEELLQSNGVGRIVFTKISDSGKDIAVANLKSGKITTLFSSAADDSYPSWSKDGKWVLFQSELCGNSDIFEIRSDGMELKRVTAEANHEQDPAWSPDNKKIVFRKKSFDGKASSISIVNRDGSNPSSINGLKKKNTFPRWSPKGDEIVFSSNQNWPGWDLVLFNLSSQKLTKLSYGSNSYVKANWRPDGNALLFSYGSLDQASIWVLAKGEDKPLQLINRAGKNFDSDFSLDGKTIYFAGESDEGSGEFLLYSYDIEKKSSDALTSVNHSFSARNPNWTPLPQFPFFLEGESDSINDKKSAFTTPTQLQIKTLCQ